MCSGMGLCLLSPTTWVLGVNLVAALARSSHTVLNEDSLRWLGLSCPQPSPCPVSETHDECWALLHRWRPHLDWGMGFGFYLPEDVDGPCVAFDDHCGPFSSPSHHVPYAMQWGKDSDTEPLCDSIGSYKGIYCQGQDTASRSRSKGWGPCLHIEGLLTSSICKTHSTSSPARAAFHCWALISGSVNIEEIQVLILTRGAFEPGHG